MKRFVLHPGVVQSVNDHDRHKITAPQLAQLYGVRMSECIVVDRDRPETVDGLGDLSIYLHLFPSYQGAAYWQISESERQQYPIQDKLPERGVIVRAGENRFAVFRPTSIKQLWDLVRVKMARI